MPTNEQIESNLQVLRDVMDRRTYSVSEHCVKLEELSSLLGLASETRSNAFRLCATNEKLAIDMYNLKGAAINKTVQRYTPYENALYEYSNKVFESMIEQIGALRTIISQHKKEII